MVLCVWRKICNYKSNYNIKYKGFLAFNYVLNGAQTFALRYFKK